MKLNETQKQLVPVHGEAFWLVESSLEPRTCVTFLYTPPWLIISLMQL